MVKLVPGQDHIVRYAGYRLCNEDPDGTIRPSGSAFLGRPRKDEEGVSYNWLEYWAGDIDQQLDAIRSKSRLDLRPKARYARLNVSQVLAHLESELPEELNALVVQDPLPPEGTHSADPSHALMTNIPTSDNPIGEMVGDLINECVLDVYPAKKTSPIDSQL